MLKGSLVKLSAKGAEVSSQTSVVPLSNIKFNLLTLNNLESVSEDIYAKVLEKETNNGNFCIHFTSLPPDVESMLNDLYESCISHS
jgi:adenylate cyclase